MSAMTDNDFHDPLLDAALARLPLQPSLPTAAARSAIHAAAGQAVRGASGRSRRWLPFVVGGLVVAALAATVAVNRRSAELPPVAAGSADQTVVQFPLPSEEEQQRPMPPMAIARNKVVAAVQGVVGNSELRLPPPQVTRFDYVQDAVRERFQPFLNSPGDGTFTLALLFDAEHRLLKAIGPAPFAMPAAGERPDPAATDPSAEAIRQLGITPQDYAENSMIMMPNPPLEGHPRVLAMAFTLRSAADVEAEHQVRAAAADYFRSSPVAPSAGGAVPLLTAVMDAQGRFEATSLDYRSLEIGSGPLEGAFAADEVARFSQLGIDPAQLGKHGTVVLAGKDAPAGAPAGIALVSYAWPKSLRADSPVTANPPFGGMGADRAAVVRFLRALFGETALLDNSDGRRAWVLLDREGRVLRSGRGSTSDPRRSLQFQVTEQVPGLVVQEYSSGDYPDPDHAGKWYSADLMWVAPNSPEPQ